MKTGFPNSSFIIHNSAAMTRTSSAAACGKIILSGEYAVVFGKSGIAIPSSMKIDVSFTPKSNGPIIEWRREAIRASSTVYAKHVAEEIREHSGVTGTFSIEGALPIGKGMGASTAMVIAMCRAALGEDCHKLALSIEDKVNPDHSGLDFAVIWEEKPVVFRKGSTPERVMIDRLFLENPELIDTGAPNETTPELVAWIRKRYEARESSVVKAIETIGECTERIISGEPLKSVMRDHHRAQVALGVVPEDTQKIIADIEARGGAAKVIGAGGRTGGGGMVLALRSCCTFASGGMLAS